MFAFARTTATLLVKYCITDCVLYVVVSVGCNLLQWRQAGQLEAGLQAARADWEAARAGAAGCRQELDTMETHIKVGDVSINPSHISTSFGIK